MTRSACWAQGRVGGDRSGQFVGSGGKTAPGGAWLLDQLWHRRRIDTSMKELLAGTRRYEITERALFSLVANRALAPSSKLAAASWVSRDVHVPGLLMAWFAPGSTWGSAREVSSSAEVIASASVLLHRT